MVNGWTTSQLRKLRCRVTNDVASHRAVTVDSLAGVHPAERRATATDRAFRACKTMLK
jgi:hypothetical protein